MYKSKYTGEYYFSKYEMELDEARKRREVERAGGKTTTVVSYDAYGRRKTTTTTTTTTTVAPAPRPMTREEREAAAGAAIGVGAFVVGATLLGALFGGDD